VYQTRLLHGAQFTFHISGTGYPATVIGCTILQANAIDGRWTAHA